MVSSELFIGLPLIIASIILTEISILSSDKSEVNNQLKPFKSIFIITLAIPLIILFFSSIFAFADLLLPSKGIISISIVLFASSYPLLITGTIASIGFISTEDVYA